MTDKPSERWELYAVLVVYGLFPLCLIAFVGFLLLQPRDTTAHFRAHHAGDLRGVPYGGWVKDNTLWLVEVHEASNQVEVDLAEYRPGKERVSRVRTALPVSERSPSVTAGAVVRLFVELTAMGGDPFLAEGARGLARTEWSDNITSPSQVVHQGHRFETDGAGNLMLYPAHYGDSTSPLRIPSPDRSWWTRVLGGHPRAVYAVTSKGVYVLHRPGENP